ncbi:hypothetical protein OH77DRAFT_573508 [Trametes cingulata]|nr:hypothetical protein OH77DRAFT_573508 [Trametes cingulata]
MSQRTTPDSSVSSTTSITAPWSRRKSWIEWQRSVCPFSNEDNARRKKTEPTTSWLSSYSSCSGSYTKSTTIWSPSTGSCYGSCCAIQINCQRGTEKGEDLCKSTFVFRDDTASLNGKTDWLRSTMKNKLAVLNSKPLTDLIAGLTALVLRRSISR